MEFFFFPSFNLFYSLLLLASLILTCCSKKKNKEAVNKPSLLAMEAEDLPLSAKETPPKVQPSIEEVTVVKSKTKRSAKGKKIRTKTTQTLSKESRREEQQPETAKTETAEMLTAPTMQTDETNKLTDKTGREMTDDEQPKEEQTGMDD